MSANTAFIEWPLKIRLTVVVFNVLTFGLYRFVTVVKREMKERAELLQNTLATKSSSQVLTQPTGRLKMVNLILFYK